MNLTLRQAAAYLCMSPATFRRRVRKHVAAHEVSRRKLLFRREDLDRFLDERTEEPAPEKSELVLCGARVIWNPPDDVERVPPPLGVTREHVLGAMESSERVYFVQCDRGPIKIGRARNVVKRHHGLQTASPYPMALLLHVPGGATLEHALHKRFVKHHIRGEWFRPDEEILELVALLKQAVAR